MICHSILEFENKIERIAKMKDLNIKVESTIAFAFQTSYIRYHLV